MKYALSARYGGLLVETSECNYSSFKHLHLLCPECKRSVYLVAGTERIPHERKLKDGGKTEVKGAVIEAYFAHHPDVSKSQVNDCELRVSTISKAQKEVIKLQSHNQLVKKLHAHFWKILQTSYKINDFEEKIEMLRQLWGKTCVYEKKRSDRFYQILIETLAKDFSEDPNGLNKAIPKVFESQERYLNWLKERQKGCILGASQETLDFVNSWELALNKRLQLSIVQEMIAFLIQKRQTPILLEMIEFCLFEEMYIRGFERVYGSQKIDLLSCFGFRIDENIDKLIPEICKEIRKLIGASSEDLRHLSSELSANLVHTFIFTDWAGEYTRFENLEQNIQLSSVGK